MKKMMMIGLYGLVILGASAAGTWYLRQRDLAAQAAEDAKPDPLQESAAELKEPVNITQPLQEQKNRDLPVAVRPGKMSVEEIVRYGLGLKDREAAIRDREEALRRTETQHRLVLADIDGEQKEIDGMLAQARNQRVAAEQLLAKAQKERLASEQLLKDLEDRKKKMEIEKERSAAKSGGSTADSEVDREANLKELVSIVQGMSSENAARVLKNYVNDGNMEMAVQILAKLEERTASQIMDSLTQEDDKLGGELLAKVMDMKKKKL